MFYSRANPAPYFLWLILLGIGLVATPLQASDSFEESVVRSRVDSMKNSALEPRFTRAVMSYVRTYTELNRPHAEQILGRTVLYFPLFEKMLREAGVPEDLKYLAIVESALDPKAISWVGAKGLWQFMPATGQYYGLRIEDRIDERCDPEKSTQAAIRYLQDAYERFGDWALAIAAYNSGGGRVSRAIKRGRSKDFWRIKRFLPRETRNYVPAFIGAQYLIEFYGEHGLKPEYPPLDLQLTTEIQVYQGLSFFEIAQVTGVPVDWLEWLNPSFQLGYIPESSRGRSLRLPKRVANRMVEYLASRKEQAAWPNERLGLPIRLNPDRSKASDPSEGYEKRMLELSPDADLEAVADRFSVTLRQLESWNPGLQEQSGYRKIVVYQPLTEAGLSHWRFDAPMPELQSIPPRAYDLPEATPLPPIPVPCAWMYFPVRLRLDQIRERFPTLSISSFRERNEIPENRRKIPENQPLCICPDDFQIED
jgi:membrane-bound lytic murein transglycosylase D